MSASVFLCFLTFQHFQHRRKNNGITEKGRLAETAHERSGLIGYGVRDMA